jgi:hypothetical protein
MLVSAPDSVMAEAGAMKPRPAFASSIMTAEPAAHILWWPEPRYLADGALSRLRWLLENGGPGGAWLVLDADDDALPTLDALRDLVSAAGLAVAGEQTFAGGRALHLVLPPG